MIELGQGVHLDKTCKHCGITSDVCKFPSTGWKNGKQYRKNICMKCYSEHVKKPLRKEALDWYLDLKKGMKCKECGNNDIRVLDFHHLDRELKEFNISDAVRVGVGKEKLLEEIAKCDCLCANCHRIETWKHNQQKISDKS